MATRENPVTDSRRELIARAINEHVAAEGWMLHCACGWATDPHDVAIQYDLHRAHVADAVLVALGEELEQVGWRHTVDGGLRKGELDNDGRWEPVFVKVKLGDDK